MQPTNLRKTEVVRHLYDQSQAEAVTQQQEKKTVVPNTHMQAKQSKTHRPAQK
jgi:hypothetical protein